MRKFSRSEGIALGVFQFVLTGISSISVGIFFLTVVLPTTHFPPYIMLMFGVIGAIVFSFGYLTNMWGYFEGDYGGQ